MGRKETGGDWVTMGVLYYKAPHKSNTTGNEFSVWKLTDLRQPVKPIREEKFAFSVNFSEFSTSMDLVKETVLRDFRSWFSPSH